RRDITRRLSVYKGPQNRVRAHYQHSRQIRTSRAALVTHIVCCWLLSAVLELFHLSLKSGQTADNRFSCCRTSPTTDCISSPPWTLFAKNLNRSAVRRNCFSQLGVKPDPLDLLGCGPASFALPASFAFSALFALSTTGAFSSKATRGLFSIGSCCLPGVENQR